MSILINGTSYNELSFTSHKTLNDELESGEFVINTSERLEIQPYDVIGISALGDYYYLIDTYVCEMIRTEAAGYPIFRYTISFIEVTKYLQAITLSNRSITQPIMSWGTRRTCKDAVLRLLKSIDFSISVNAATQTLLDTKESPEFAWNRPTLYEVLKDIFAQFDCLPKLIYLNNTFTLTTKSLSMTSTELAKTNVVETKTTLGMSNYAKKLDLEIENAASNVLNCYEDKLQVRSNDGIVTDDSAIVILEHNIYGVKKCVLKAAYAESGSSYSEEDSKPLYYNDGAAVYELDITNHICSKDVYDYLASSTSATVSDGSFKRNYLYFDGNTINGINVTEKVLGIVNSSSAIHCIIINAAAELGQTATNLNSVIACYRFYVEYETLDSLKVEFENENQGLNDVTLIDNQSDSYIDANAFAKIKQDNVNYMSNEVVQINCIFKSSEVSSAVDVGAYYTFLGDKYIIYDKKVSRLPGNQYRVVYMASKKYPKINRSMVLNQAKRYTQLADASSSFLRQEHVKLGNYYLTTTSASSDSISNLALDFNNSITNQRKNYHVARATYYYGESEESYSSYLYLNSFNNRVGKTIILTTKFYNSNSAGLQITDKDSGGYTEKRVSYVNEYGELDKLTIWLCSGKDALQKAKKYPEKESQSAPTTYLLNKVLDIYKDNREQLGLSFQINFKDTDDFTIHEGLLNLNPLLLRSSSSSVTLQVYNNDTLDSNASVSISGNTITLTGLTKNVTGYNIRDNSGNKLITINEKTTASSMNIYLAKES